MNYCKKNIVTLSDPSTRSSTKRTRLLSTSRRQDDLCFSHAERDRRSLPVESKRESSFDSDKKRRHSSARQRGNAGRVGQIRCATMILVLLVVVLASAGAQFVSPIKIKVNYTPMVNIRETDDSYKEKFLADPEKTEASLSRLISVKDTLVGLSVFSISSYENIQLMMDVAPLTLGNGQDMPKSPYKLIKAYVNNGSSSAGNAIAINKNRFGFALSNSGVLRRSLQSDLNRFTAYVYVLVVRPKIVRDSRKEAFASLITIEYQ